tara:strand:+ start:1032 stop:3080 length:2049 start_codon:yes stop_codon:yes gene_type:complete
MNNRSINYYKHIDGLRALAVLAVLLTHLDFKLFSGGFIGVDVFFVISGFLITTIIIKELESTNKFSFLNFYVRRIRRIMPALTFTLVISFIFSVWLLNLAKFKVFGGSLATASLSISNIFFYTQAGYFDIFSQSNPLLHTWSLGVEEQFYIFWPILLLVTFKFFRKHFISVLLGLFVISLMLNFMYQNKNLIALFYLVQFRAFEFCIGAFIVWLLKFSKDMKNSLLELLCFIGIIFILYSVFIYDSETLFPSYNALLPAIGSALVIYSGSAKYIGLIFRVKPVRFIGLISYSLYLIHWPLIVFFKTYNENIGLPFSISLSTKLLVVLLSILIAALMYYFVEQPFRRSIPKSKSMQMPLIARWLLIIVLLTSLGASIFYSKGWLWRANAPIAASHIDNISKYHQENWGGADFYGGYIHKGKSIAPAIVMMGDSHSGMLDEGMLKEIAQSNDLSIFTVSGGGAGKYLSSLLLPGVTRLDTPRAASDESAKTGYIEALKKLNESKNSILIYSASYWSQINIAGDLETHKSWGIDTKNTKKYQDYEPFTKALDKMRELIKGHKFILIGDVPSASKYNVMTCMTGLKWFTSNSCLSKQLEPSTNLGAINVNHILQEYANKHKNVYFINPYNIFCKKGFCINVDGQGTPLYSDGSHLSKTGSIYFIKHIKKKLLNLVNHNIESAQNQP